MCYWVLHLVVFPWTSCTGRWDHMRAHSIQSPRGCGSVISWDLRKIVVQACVPRTNKKELSFNLKGSHRTRISCFSVAPVIHEMCQAHWITLPHPLGKCARESVIVDEPGKQLGSHTVQVIDAHRNAPCCQQTYEP